MVKTGDRDNIAAMQRLVSSTLLAAAALALPTTAHAQAWIGQYAANVSAQHKAAKAERECQAGIPPKPSKAKRAAQDADALMAAMLRLNAAAPRQDLATVFDVSEDAGGWKDLSGHAPFAALGDRLRPPDGARFERMRFVTGNDATTARGLWLQTNSTGAPPKVYAVAFAWLPVSLFGNGWRITRLRVMDVGEPRPDTSAYCHLPLIWP